MILFLCVFYASHSFADLVGHWKFDETTGTMAADSSGNYNQGIVVGTGTFDAYSTAGRLGSPNTAIHMDGTYYINCGHDFTVDPIHGLTIAAWVKLASGTQAAYATVIDKEYHNPPAYGGYTLMVNPTGAPATGTVGSFMANGTGWVGATGTKNLSDGAWHFIAATYNGAGIQTYVDGLPDGFTAMPTYFSSQPADLTIGSGAPLFPVRFFNGAVDEVAIWDTALSATEIEAVIDNGITDPVITEPFEKILWLKADIGVQQDPNGVSVWQDQSGKGMDAVRKWGNPTLVSSTFPNGSHPVVHFDGNAGLIIDPNALVELELSDIYPRSISVYVVGRIDDLAMGQTFVANYSQPGDAGFGLGISNTQLNTAEYFDTRGGVYEPNQPLELDRYYLLSYTISYASERKIYLNGELLNTGFGRPTYNHNTVTSIGAVGSEAEFLTGDIAEIIVYKGVDDTENDDIIDGLMADYQIDTSEPKDPYADPNFVTLTAMTLSRCNSAGGMIETELWNTYYPDTVGDTAIFEGQIPADPNAFDPNLFLNHPTYMVIHIALQDGEERTFTWYNARENTDTGYFGVNLFFDDSQFDNIPGLSVFAQMDTDGPDNGNPEFTANGAASTMGWPYNTVPGTGSRIYSDPDKKLKVTMTKFVTYRQDVFKHDLITAQAAGHPLAGRDGTIDMIGQFTLKVEQNVFCEDLGVYFDADINEDCSVDLADMAYLVSDWLKCNDPLNLLCLDVP